MSLSCVYFTINSAQSSECITISHSSLGMWSKRIASSGELRAFDASRVCLSPGFHEVPVASWSSWCRLVARPMSCPFSSVMAMESGWGEFVDADVSRQDVGSRSRTARGRSASSDAVVNGWSGWKADVNVLPRRGLLHAPFGCSNQVARRRVAGRHRCSARLQGLTVRLWDDAHKREFGRWVRSGMWNWPTTTPELIEHDFALQRGSEEEEGPRLIG
jgi:hypothetical protein